jgi:hypothetical protein
VVWGVVEEPFWKNSVIQTTFDWDLLSQNKFRALKSIFQLSAVKSIAMRGKFPATFAGILVGTLMRAKRREAHGVLYVEDQKGFQGNNEGKESLRNNPNLHS